MIVVWVEFEPFSGEGRKGSPELGFPKILRCHPASSFCRGGLKSQAMFDRISLDKLFDELRDEYELEPEWEDIQRDAHLAVARHDAGMPLGEIDSRVEGLVKKYSPD